ncbi:MAG: ZPR1 zinc finger domain-containing protein [Candidatus Aenigmatarchaeota archaeon]
MIFKCPYCNEELKTIFEEKKIKYFGRVLFYTIYCEKCGFKFSDEFTLDVKEPKAYYLKVENENDLFAKIVRGSNGYVEIKELGIKLIPGAFSKSFIKNVEGFLNDVEDIIKSQLKNLSGKKLEKAKKLLEEIEKMKRLEKKFTIVVKDVTGISKIISKKAKVRKLTEKEIKKLKTSITYL